MEDLRPVNARVASARYALVKWIAHGEFRRALRVAEAIVDRFQIADVATKAAAMHASSAPLVATVTMSRASGALLLSFLEPLERERVCDALCGALRLALRPSHPDEWQWRPRRAASPPALTAVPRMGVGHHHGGVEPPITCAPSTARDRTMAANPERSCAADRSKCESHECTQGVEAERAPPAGRAETEPSRRRFGLADSWTSDSHCKRCEPVAQPSTPRGRASASVDKARHPRAAPMPASANADADATPVDVDRTKRRMLAHPSSPRKSLVRTWFSASRPRNSLLSLLPSPFAKADAKSSHAQHQQHQRASCPSLRSSDRRRPSLTQKAGYILQDAWSALYADRVERMFSPPQMLLRTQRKISQAFNVKVVRAVSKDRRRHSRSSFAVTSAFSTSSASSATTVECGRASVDVPEDSSELDRDVDELSMRDRISLSLARRLSRDFVPMLTEGSALECHVREIVFARLQDTTSLEGHVCSRFFEKQEEFTATTPAACRYYLNRVRETMNDLVQFIVEFRLRDGEALVTNQEFAQHDSQEIAHAVRRAVEEYFCFSLRFELHKWGSGVAQVDRRSRLRRKLGRWSALPSSSAEFGLLQASGDLATHPLIASAIDKLRAIDTIMTPSRKMDSLLAACHALSDFIAQNRTLRGGSASPHGLQHSNNNTNSDATAPTDARVCVGAADTFLPLLIFALARSNLREPLVTCALLAEVYPFQSLYGERRYYLTMLEASLEFIRTHQLET